MVLGVGDVQLCTTLWVCVAGILQSLSDSCAEREARADAVRAMTVGNSGGVL